MKLVQSPYFGNTDRDTSMVVPIVPWEIQVAKPGSRQLTTDKWNVPKQVEVDECGLVKLNISSTQVPL